MFRRKPAPDLIRGGHRFADKNMRQSRLVPIPKERDMLQRTAQRAAYAAPGGELPEAASLRRGAPGMRDGGEIGDQ
jgi:hypothetical protein